MISPFDKHKKRLKGLALQTSDSHKSMRVQGLHEPISLMKKTLLAIRNVFLEPEKPIKRR